MKQKVEIQRLGGYLKEVITFLDDSGKPIGSVVNPLMVELKPRDVAQIFVGSFLVAAPLCFTEEVWKLSEELPLLNTYYLILCSFVTVVCFVYFNFYRNKLRGNVINFIKRIIAVYTITTTSVCLMLFLINKLPFDQFPFVSFKRVIMIAFPSVFGGLITDSLK